MSEAVVEPVVEPVVEAPSGLPSDQPPVEAYDGFALSDDQKALFKDNKLNGRFGSLDEVLVKLKEAEDFKSQHGRDVKLEGEQQVAEKTLEVNQGNVINAMIPEFMKNGMKLTPEMETKATEAKIDIRDLKIGAMELREKITGVYATAGGKENYDNAHAWAKDNLSDSEKKLFTSDVDSGVSGASTIAVEWLMQKYDVALKAGTTTPRIEGSHHNVGLQPYENRRELYRDKDYIESPKGRRDTAAVKQYRSRLKITPDAVVFGNR